MCLTGLQHVQHELRHLTQISSASSHLNTEDSLHFCSLTGKTPVKFLLKLLGLSQYYKAEPCVQHRHIL